VVLDPEHEEAVKALATKLGGERKQAAAIRRILTVGIGALKASGEIPQSTGNPASNKD
jgi:hypothetical protein